MNGAQIAVDGFMSAFEWIFVPWLVLAGLAAGILVGWRTLSAVLGFIAGSLYAGLMLYLHGEFIPGRIMGESFLVMQIAATLVTWLWTAAGVGVRFGITAIRAKS